MISTYHMQHINCPVLLPALTVPSVNYYLTHSYGILLQLYTIIAHLHITFIRGFDCIEQCFTSPPTQYRLYGRRFFTGQKTQPTVSKYSR